MFNQKCKKEAQPVHHVLPYIKQQSHFSIITYNLQTSAKERKKIDQQQQQKTHTPKVYLAGILCEFKLDTRIRSLLIRDEKKNKISWRTLVSQETVDAHLRVPCSSRMPAQVGAVTRTHSELGRGTSYSLEAVQLPWSSALHSRVRHAEAGKITLGSLPCKWVYSAFQPDQLRVWTGDKRNTQGCLQPSIQSDLLGWSHSVSVLGFIWFWKRTSLTTRKTH